MHGDVRLLDDLLAVEEIDALVECSAEPSVLAGYDGSPDYLIGSNLIGAYNCLELARRRRAHVVFLSTSRVYPIAPLESLVLEETDTRFELGAEQPVRRRLAGRYLRGRFPSPGPGVCTARRS